MTALRSRTPRRALVAFAAASALTMSTAAAADAGSWSHADPAGDVVAFDETPTGTPAPTREAGDVRRTSISHGSTRIGIKIKMRKHVKAYSIFYFFSTPNGRYELSRMRLPGMSEVELRKGKSTKAISCSGITWTAVRSRGTMAVSIPRSCLGNPRWIKAGVGVAAFGDEAFYGDDALQTGVTKDIDLSPKVRRG
jgi:hypothetical protein